MRPPTRWLERHLDFLEPVIVRPFAIRGAIHWLGLRIGVATLASLMGVVRPDEILRWHAGGALAMLSTCIVIGLLDVRRRGERALLGNLGVHDHEIALVLLAPAVLGELLLAVLFR